MILQVPCRLLQSTSRGSQLHALPAQVSDWLTSSREVKLSATGEPVEVELASGLRHDHVVRIHASQTRRMGDIEDNSSVKVMQTWLVMEYCNQGSLAEAFESGRFRLPRSKVSLPRQAALVISA